MSYDAPNNKSLLPLVATGSLIQQFIAEQWAWDSDGELVPAGSQAATLSVDVENFHQLAFGFKDPFMVRTGGDADESNPFELLPNLNNLAAVVTYIAPTEKGVAVFFQCVDSIAGRNVLTWHAHGDLVMAPCMKMTQGNVVMQDLVLERRFVKIQIDDKEKKVQP